MNDHFTRLGIKSVEMMSCSLPIIFNQYVGELNYLKAIFDCNHFIHFDSVHSTIPYDEIYNLYNNRKLLASKSTLAASQYSSDSCFPKLATIYENI